MQEKLLNTKELAAAISVSVRTVESWRISRNGKPPKLVPCTTQDGKRMYSQEQVTKARALLDKKLSSPPMTPLEFGTQDTPPDDDRERYDVNQFASTDGQLSDNPDLDAEKNNAPTDAKNNRGNCITPADNVNKPEIDCLFTAQGEISKKLTLDQRANRIRQRAQDWCHNSIEIGRDLIFAKEEIGHGGWAKWLETEFNWTQRTANNFMRMAERFGKMENVFQFQPSTLQAMLALPEGTEQDFIDEQDAAGRPIETQSKMPPDLRNAG